MRLVYNVNVNLRILFSGRCRLLYPICYSILTTVLLGVYSSTYSKYGPHFCLRNPSTLVCVQAKDAWQRERKFGQGVRKPDAKGNGDLSTRAEESHGHTGPGTGVPVLDANASHGATFSNVVTPGKCIILQVVKGYVSFLIIRTLS